MYGHQRLELPPLEQRALLPKRRIQQFADGPGQRGGEEHEERNKPGQVGANLAGGVGSWGGTVAAREVRGGGQEAAGLIVSQGFGSAGQQPVQGPGGSCGHPTVRLQGPDRQTLTAAEAGALPKSRAQHSRDRRRCECPTAAAGCAPPAARSACTRPEAGSRQTRGWQRLHGSKPARRGVNVGAQLCCDSATQRPRQRSTAPAASPRDAVSSR
jgi:hypothetical protein